MFGVWYSMPSVCWGVLKLNCGSWVALIHDASKGYRKRSYRRGLRITQATSSNNNNSLNDNGVIIVILIIIIIVIIYPSSKARGVRPNRPTENMKTAR